MTKRKKNKFEKRNHHVHYKDYKRCQRVIEILESKYGKENVHKLLGEKRNGYSSNMLFIKTNRKGWPIDADIYMNVYPAAVNNEPPQQPILLKYPCWRGENGEPVEPPEFIKRATEYDPWIHGIED